MRRGLAVAASTLLLACPSALAQDSFSFGVIVQNVPGARHLKETDLPASVRGSVTVSFHGSEGAGCAPLGVCGTSGTVEWRPGEDAGLGVVRYVQRGRHHITGTLSFQDESTVETTRRRRADGTVALCSDAVQPVSLAPADRPGSHALSLRLADDHALQDSFRTRCAGPPAKDIVPLLPVRPLPRSVVRGGGAVVDMSTTRPFSAGGFAGTVRSTVVIRVRRPLKDLGGSFAGRPVRYRTVQARYRIEHVSGAVTERFQGLAAPGGCDPLGSCGASGSVQETVPDGRGAVEFDALTRARVSPRQALALFGAAHGRVARLSADGAGAWLSRDASTAADVSFADGSPSCHDTVSVASGFVSGTVDARGLRLTYISGPFTTEPLVSHCQGPMTNDLAPAGSLAAGSVPARALRGSVVRVVLTRAAADHAAVGYTGSISSRIVVTLRRVSVRTRTVTDRF